MTEFDPEMTLAEARAQLRLLIDEGHACPCCTQFAKVYRRKINSTMARTLIRIARADSSQGFGTFIHTASLPGDTHEASQLSWWDLIEEERVRRPDGGRAGHWRLTNVGRLFVLARISVAKYAHIYDGRVLRMSGEPITIHQALGAKFNYHELMHGTP